MIWLDYYGVYPLPLGLIAGIKMGNFTVIGDFERLLFDLDLLEEEVEETINWYFDMIKAKNGVLYG